MITDIDDFFAKGCGRCARFDTPDCSARLWAPGLSALRALCLKAGLTETVKWGHPCYTHAGRNIVLFGAFRGDFRLSLFNAGLLDDPLGLLEKSGPNSATPNTIRFSEAAQVAQLEPALTAMLRRAMDHAEAGRTAPKPERTLDLPDELVTALDADPVLAEGFHALTPGRQKSHVLAINGAKKSETRIARIAKLRARILAGKGANER